PRTIRSFALGKSAIVHPIRGGPPMIPPHEPVATAAHQTPHGPHPPRGPLPGTFSATILCAFCRALGLDPLKIVSPSRAQQAALADAEGRVPLDIAFRVFDEAPHRTGIGHAGLVAAQRTPLGSLGIMDLLCRASATIGEGLERVHRYYALIDDRTTIEVVPEGGLTRLVLRDRTDMPAPRVAREYFFGLIAGRWQALTGTALPAVQLSWPFPRPPNVDVYRDAFGGEVRFDQPFNELLIEAAGFRAPVRTADPIVLDYLEGQADAAIARLPRRDAWLDGVRRSIIPALAAHEASLEAAARYLAMSPRSLQRRLHEAGVSYQELVDSVRRELGVRFVLDGALGIEAIAERLDFSDATSFHRAFKRWTGATPRAYRHRLSA
ncbi:MAG TPA: AraC family transcriptional regulator, partial [Vicinamibacteria bacterium]|nr:AraC family transcriptional regulator [Vicinamibacteria bacterium]